MKKYLKILFITSILIAAFVISASAQSIAVEANKTVKETDDGIRYSVVDDEYVVIEGYNVISLSLKIPATIDGMKVKEIKTLALYGNQYINSLEIAEGVEAIGDEAFAYCKNLISVKLPSTIKTIPKSAFEGCASLSSVEISFGTERIETSAFEGCKILGSVKIPTSVTYIGGDAFFGCEKLILNCSENDYAKAYADRNFISTSYFSGMYAVVIWSAVVTAIGAVVIFVLIPKYVKKKNK